MTTTIDNPRLAVFASVLGDELRRLRTKRGWTRKELLRHLESHISIQTVATYELGSRQCSVIRLVELCHALGVHAHDLLARVQARADIDVSDRLVLDLHQIVRDRQAELAPLRRWAQQRLVQAKRDHAHAVALELAALESMAQLCGMTTVDLVRRLRQMVHHDPRLNTA
jgi:transcriptional regulator with XRE-family HTH domain